MPQINYKALPEYLASQTESAAVVLLGGEEYLCRQAQEHLMAAWLPTEDRAFYCDRFDGRFDDQVVAALEQINTYGLLCPKRIITITDTPLLDTRTNTQALLDVVQKGWEDDDRTSAAAAFVRLLSRLNLNYDDVREADTVPAEVRRMAWFDDLLAYCRHAAMIIPESKDVITLLLQALAKGFPSGHRLLLVATSLDQRSRITKAVTATGLVINCDIPRGARKADREAQTAVLQGCITGVLQRHGKTMDGATRQALLQLTGFDPRLVVNNLQKLVDYTGAETHIGLTAVTSLLQRTRKDPIFELTGAMAARRLDQALFYMHSLLHDNLHPLQILAAMLNQVRRLLLAREFLASPYAQDWRPNSTYPQFQAGVFAQVAAFDAEIEGWIEPPPPPAQDTREKRSPASARKSSRAQSDLVLGKNPYPLFLLLQHAAAFSSARLIEVMERLQQADLALKSSTRQPEMVLEEVLLFMLLPNALPDPQASLQSDPQARLQA